MDTELRFISSLLSANKAEQLEFWNKQVPLALFQLREKEMHWIYQFRERHSRFPSKTAFELKFDDSPLEEVEDPLFSVLEPIYTQAAYKQIKEVMDLTANKFDEKADPRDIIESFRAGAEKVSTYDVATVDESLSDPSIALRRYKETVNQSRQGGTVLDTPWPKLTRLITSARAGEVTAIAARMAMGKTWAALAWAHHLAELRGVPTLVISKEMPTPQIADRISAIRFKLDWVKFRAMDLDVFDQVNWKIAARKAASKPYPLVVSGEETLEGIGVQQVYAKIMKIRPRAVFIDGAYLLTASGVSKNANDVEKATAISRAVKRIAKVTKTSIYIVLQMNRNAESTNKKSGVSIAKGGLSTVYGADAWGQDVDALIEMAGVRGEKERVLMVHKSRETNIGDLPINFQLDPFPNFSEKAMLSSSSKLGGSSFKILR